MSCSYFSFHGLNLQVVSCFVLAAWKLIRAIVSLSPEAWHERLWVQKGRWRLKQVGYRCSKFPFDNLFLSYILSCLINKVVCQREKIKLVPNLNSKVLIQVVTIFVQHNTDFKTNKLPVRIFGPQVKNFPINEVHKTSLTLEPSPSGYSL